MKEITESGGLLCANCATPMHGEFCHECGQSIHSVLKPVHGMLEDTLDIVLHVDGRAMHTIPPLLTKPGFLTLEYFSGRRVRYVAPFRLMFVLCLLAFFLGHIALDQATNKISHAEATHGPSAPINAFADAGTTLEVKKKLDQQVAQLRLTREAVGSSTGLDLAEAALRKQAAQRTAELDGSAPAKASSSESDDGLVQLDEGDKKGWLFKPTHVDIAWLPGFMNARLEKGLQHMKLNLLAMKAKGEARDDAMERLKAGTFAVLPQTMFVLMPIFALLLKIMYIFRRRLYMEHLIVALHSHAFLFLNLIVGIVLSMLAAWLVPHAGNWLGSVFRLLEWALAIWALVYLLLMQKRVYRQGWFLTSVKYFVVGWCYLWMLFFALLFAVILGMAH